MSWCKVGSHALANVTMLFLNKEFENWERYRQMNYLPTKTNGKTCRIELTRKLNVAWRAA